MEAFRYGPSLTTSDSPSPSTSPRTTGSVPHDAQGTSEPDRWRRASPPARAHAVPAAPRRGRLLGLSSASWHRRAMRAFSVGHSTHSLEGFVGLLARHGVERVVDVRRTPRSRRHPQFERDSLAAELPARGVDYRHLAALGGRRRARPDSPNGGWEHPAFRGYADYALTDEFAIGLAELLALAQDRPTAVMCAE